jgi:hypothetical protein
VQKSVNITIVKWVHISYGNAATRQ